jgi:hypothetical protein
MSKIIEKPLRLKEATDEQPDSTDPDYLSWVDEKVAKGQADLKESSKRIPADQVWEALGIER